MSCKFSSSGNFSVLVAKCFVEEEKENLLVLGRKMYFGMIGSYKKIGITLHESKISSDSCSNGISSVYNILD